MNKKALRPRRDADVFWAHSRHVWICVLHRLEDYASRLMFSFVCFGICRLEKPFGQDVFWYLILVVFKL